MTTESTTTDVMRSTVAGAPESLSPDPELPSIPQFDSETSLEETLIGLEQALDSDAVATIVTRVVNLDLCINTPIGSACHCGNRCVERGALSDS
jgi:hypothetical protein